MALPTASHRKLKPLRVKLGLSLSVVFILAFLLCSNTNGRCRHHPRMPADFTESLTKPRSTLPRCPNKAESYIELLRLNLAKIEG